MKRFIFYILLILGCGAIEASTIPTNLPEYKAVVRSGTDKVRGISDEARFYLVTCEPGDEIYERFGHSGIRVYDPKNEIDEVFHWGLFSFDTPNFVGRFIAGKTDYLMGVYNTEFFMLQYTGRGSSVYAQELDLTIEQKHCFWAKLWNNYRPENRTYRYNFIYDNCATRPYQLILSAYEYNVRLDYQNRDITYRNIINSYIPVGTAYNTGINLIIGSRADKYISAKESVSFPMYTMDVLNCTKYVKDGELKRIVKNQEVMNKAPLKNFEANSITYYGWIIVPLLIALGCGIFTRKKHKPLPIVTEIVLLITGLVGVVITYLWFFSHHPLVSNNTNLLWCNPINIIFAVLLFIHKKGIRNIKMILSMLNVVLCILFIIGLIVEYQTTTPQILALWTMTIVVNTTIGYKYKNQIKGLLQK